MILDDILENGETRRLDPELISSASIIRYSEILTGHLLVVSTVPLPRFQRIFSCVVLSCVSMSLTDWVA
jgi:hypothetical protein